MRNKRKLWITPKTKKTVFASILALSLLYFGFIGIADAHEIWFYCPQTNVKVGDSVRVEYGVGEILFIKPDPNWLDWIEKELPATKIYVVDPDGKKSEIELKKEKNVFAGTFRAEKKGTYLVNMDGNAGNRKD